MCLIYTVYNWQDNIELKGHKFLKSLKLFTSNNLCLADKWFFVRTNSLFFLEARHFLNIQMAYDIFKQ